MSVGTQPEPREDREEEQEELRGQMSFLDHLEELRRRILRSLIAVGAAFGVCFGFFPNQLFAIISRPILKALPPGETLKFMTPTEPFNLSIKISFVAALFLAAPFLMGQIWLFIAPGLYKHERRYAAPFIIFASLFFIARGYFGFRVLLPGTCAFFVETGKQFKQMVTIDDYFSFASSIILAAGLVFETPILIFF